MYREYKDGGPTRAVFHEEMFTEISGWLSVRRTHTGLASTYDWKTITCYSKIEIYIPFS
jgi:hypothetical protein